MPSVHCMVHCLVHYLVHCTVHCAVHCLVQPYLVHRMAHRMAHYLVHQDANDLFALCRVSRAVEVDLAELRRPPPHAASCPMHLAFEAERKGVARMQARVRQRVALVVPRPHPPPLARVPLPCPCRGSRAPREQSARAPEGLVTPG